MGRAKVISEHSVEPAIEAEAEVETVATTVQMYRNEIQYPAPYVADVHVDEVENWRKGGWTLEANPVAVPSEPVSARIEPNNAGPPDA